MILHIMISEKFMAPFIDFVDNNFGREQHKYVFITSEKYIFGLTPEHNVEFLHTDEDIFETLLNYMKAAQKIILHGLWRDKIDQILVQEPLLLEKCYWIMWGGDFYFPEKHSKDRHFVIKNVAHLITLALGDVNLVRREYQASGKHISSVAYTSNIFDGSRPSISSTKEFIRVQIGNSAGATNNHLDVFSRLNLSDYSGDIEVYCPLSYGSKEYAAEVMRVGSALFGRSFVPMTEFLSYQDYMSFLDSVDIAIFDHERQQAFGNIIQLLGRGKKVFLNRKSTLYSLLSEMGIHVFDSSCIDFEILTEDSIANNNSIISNYFSEHALLKSLSSWIV